MATKGSEKGLYQRGDTWCISYYHQGKHIRRAIGTKGEARKELTAIRAKIDGRTFAPPREDLFDELVDRYDEVQRPKGGYRTEKHYIRLVGNYFKGRTVQAIDVIQVEDFLTYLTDLPTKHGGKRGNVDINHHMRVLYTILQIAVNRDWITKNYATTDRVERPPKGEGRTQYFQVDEVGRLLDACLPHLYPIVLCAVETGMRKSEITGLKWSEVREVTLEDGTTAPMIFLPKERTKTKTARTVPVSNRLNEVLAKIREEQRNDSPVVALHGPVFRFQRSHKVARQGGARLRLVAGSIKDFRGAWAAAKEKAGVSDALHFHDLRRTFRTYMKRKGADNYILNEIMGHANSRIEKTYTQISNDQLVQTISLLPDWNSHITSTSSQSPVNSMGPVALVKIATSTKLAHEDGVS